MSEGNKIKVSQLQAGDIVILEKEEHDWVSTAIALLTRSKVTHTTVSRGVLPGADYNGVGYIAEECPPHAIYGSLLDRTMRVAYVMRMKEVPDDMKPVMDLIEYYVSNEWPYASGALPFIAIYYLTKDIADSKKLRKIGVKLMKLAMGVMIEILNKIFRDGKHPMMCSQFAFHCYNEAGKEYKIHLKKDSKRNLFEKIKEEIEMNYKEYEDEIDKINLKGCMDEENVCNDSYEDILKELCGELSTDKCKTDKMAVNEDKQLDRDFVITAFKFIKLFYCTFALKGKEYSLSPKELLNKFDEMEEYFVSPEDLLHNTKNLECVGTVDYEGYHM
ncbi:hypothetical protein SAMN02745248_02658 [Hathewaya proteolytica DSM 3090]|uniref:Permuted papain-like amidase enzyme, YaeF/YiiX, C92 family n=1 Tax=Hathewaya proteolytica DSM 3090 TaxID=1121331 RepID=A0A1M6SX11_9CLOT|nr:hypothetical protein [Hathewaya proteolytica]SHK49108.1 hypothetical protein SAMN02745248_02658 [Hathewaya proteolytica DSM 3090]